MQYVEKIKGSPYKMEKDAVVSVFEWLPNGDLKLTETIKRTMFFKKEEAVKAKKQIDNKLGFHKYELSEEYKSVIMSDINILQKASDDWSAAFDELRKKKDGSC